MREPCVIVLRTSTHKQETGLEAQFNSIQSLLEPYEIEPVEVPFDAEEFMGEIPPRSVEKMRTMYGSWIDEGLSGSLDPMDRPGFNAALNFARTQGIQLIVMYHNDRLSRSTEDALRYIRLMREEGRRFLFGNIPTLRFETPEDDLLFTNLAMLAQYYKDDLKRKTKAGMKRLKDEGRWLGEAPYGYYVTTKLDDQSGYGTLLYNWEELEVLNRAMKHYINHRPKPSYNATARFLNSEGHQTRRGKKWTAQHIRNILTKAVMRFELNDDNKRLARFFPEGMMEVDEG